MLITVGTLTIRVDLSDKVCYARCNKRNRFISHKTAQTLYNIDVLSVRVSQAVIVQPECSRMEATVIISLAVLANLIATYFLLQEVLS